MSGDRIDLLARIHELEEENKQLQNEVYYYKHEYFSEQDLREKLQESYNELLGTAVKLQEGICPLCENYECNNPPLKFEELKENMWVFDNLNKMYVQIAEDFDEGNGVILLRYHEDSYNSNCERTRFEENRFYMYETVEKTEL